MNPESQQIAIAEAWGWKKMNWNGVTVYGSPTHGFRVWKSKHQDSIMSYKGRAGERIPDYLNDLNACRDFEEMIGAKWPTYCEILLKIVEPEPQTLEVCHYWNLLHATAAQRCEAFLKTIGKWVTE